MPVVMGAHLVGDKGHFTILQEASSQPIFGSYLTITGLILKSLHALYLFHSFIHCSASHFVTRTAAQCAVLPEMILSPVTLLGSSLIAVPESSCPPGSVISNHHEITLLGPRHVARGTRHMLRRRMAHGHMSPPSPTWSHGLMALSLYQLSDQSRKYILGNLGLRIWATQHASEIPLRNSSDIPTRHTQTAICRYVLAVLCRQRIEMYRYIQYLVLCRYCRCLCVHKVCLYPRGVAGAWPFVKRSYYTLNVEECKTTTEDNF